MKLENLKKYEITDKAWFIRQLITWGGEEYVGAYMVGEASVIVAKAHIPAGDKIAEGDYIHITIKGTSRKETQRAKERVLAAIEAKPDGEYGKRMLEMWFKEAKSEQKI